MYSIPTFSTVANRTRRVYVVDGVTFVSFNAVHGPRPPSRASFTFWYPEHCYNQARWFTEKYPFIPFCVREPEWTGVFSCLQGTLNSFPLECNAGGYALEKQLQIKWWRLERAIFAMCQRLLDSYDKVLHSLDIELYALPQAWGFMRSHKTEIDARRRILNSRNAFIPLMGLFSYAIAISMTHSPERDDSTPRWVRILTEANRFDSELVNEFALHSYCRPTTVRVGVYIDWASFTVTNLFQYCVRFRVPVWVRLIESMPRHISNTLPDVLKVTPAEYALARNPPSIKVQERPASASRPITLFYTAPRITHLSGEPIRGYLGRYYEFRMRMIEAESQEELADRLEREQHALQFICPSREGEDVFEWQETSKGPRRQLIPQDRVPLIWSSYPNSQKFYNSIHDEWDLCRDLDPDAGNLNPDDGELIAPSPDDVLQLTENDDALTRSIMEDTYTRTDPYTHLIHIPTIDETLFLMYGFLPDGTRYVPPDPLIAAHRIPRILVEANMSGNNQPLEQIVHFISALVRGPDRVPGSLCDLHKDNIYHLKAQRFPLFRWSKVEDHLFVFRQISDPSVCLYVPSAVHVVQSMRLPTCDTLFDLASHFGLKGERFHLGELRQGKNPFKAPPACVSGLGFRRRGFKPGWLDYQAYVNRRARLLSAPAVARAALMQGGIVWRLTVDTLHELHGQVDFDSYFTSDAEPDYLSLHDLGVIVGLYRIWSDEVGADKQLSWWPQRHTWYRGGYNVEQWTTSCEAWYQNRIQGLKTAAFDAKSSSDWEKSFNLFKETRTLRKNNELACEAFLQSSLQSS